MDPLETLSPLDGRYREKTKELADYFSEGAIIKDRLLVEVEYLLALSQKVKIIRSLSLSEKNYLKAIVAKFNLRDAQEIKKIEKITNHDVKAVEYFLKEKISKNSLKDLKEMVHFGLTSEDVNNLAYGLSLKQSLTKIILPSLFSLTAELKKMADRYRSTVMLGRTHGQPAVPTTMGKEIAVFVKRLKEEIEILQKLKIKGKLNGSVGNFNAHDFVFPKIDWLKFSRDFIEQLDLEPELLTTQILAYDSYTRIFDSLKRINGILIGLCQDFWHYISLDYFQQKLIKTEVGSSTMPQKINPIFLENAEGNLGLAKSFFNFFSEKLLISRLQRDLSDSCVRRAFGEALGYSLIGYRNLLLGLQRLTVNEEKLRSDLLGHWEILTEGIQSFLRAKGSVQAYEQLKDFSRGKVLSQKHLLSFINQLKISRTDKEKLKQLKPTNYLGLAEKLAETN